MINATRAQLWVPLERLRQMQGVLRISATILLTGVCSSEAQPTDAIRVVDAMMSCMTDGVLARDDLRKVKSTGQDILDSMNNMTAHRSVLRRFSQCKITASEMPSGGVATNLAKTAVNALVDGLLRGFQESLSLQEKLLKIKTDDELRAIVPEANRINDDIDAAWKFYLTAVAATAHALVDDTRPSTEGTLNRLKLTKAEIAKLTADLKEQYPDSLKTGDKHAIDAAAGVFLKFLDQRWVASDQ